MSEMHIFTMSTFYIATFKRLYVELKSYITWNVKGKLL